MIFSTQQTAECSEHGHMSFCPHHADNTPVRVTCNNSFALFGAQNQDDTRFLFRNLAVRVAADGINPNVVNVSAMTLRNFTLGFMYADNGDPMSCYVTLDKRLMKAIRDDAHWEDRVGDAWIRAFPIKGVVDEGEPLNLILNRTVNIAGDQTDNIQLAVDDDGFAYCHVGYVLTDGGTYPTGQLRLQTDTAHEFWFDAEDGSNVLYLGMLRLNTKTGNRDEVVTVHAAADIFNGLREPASTIPTEEMVRRMFGLDRAEDGGDLGSALLNDPELIAALNKGGATVIGVRHNPDGSTDYRKVGG